MTPPKSAASDNSRTAAQENIRTVTRLQRQVRKQRSISQRVIDSVAAFAARESTVAAHLAVFAIWIAANVGVLPVRPFDPFPFSILASIVSLEAIFLTLFVLASQTRLTEDADRRAHLDLQVSLLSEQEMTLVLHMLKDVCQHLGLRHTIESRKFKELIKDTDVEELAEHLEETKAADTEPPPS